MTRSAVNLSSLAAVSIPRLPRPVGEVDRRYVDQLVEAIERAIDVLNTEQRRSFSEISLLDLQAHGANLRIGDVFEDDGVLKIVRAGEAYATSSVGTTAIGTVTVSTT